MKKLILEEDDIKQAIEAPGLDELSKTNLISSLIKNAWESVDLYNSMMITLEGDNEIIEVLNDIVNSLYINIGQLENILQGVNIQAQAIDQVSDLGDVVVPTDDIEISTK